MNFKILKDVRYLLDSVVIERIEMSDGNRENVVAGKPHVQVDNVTDGS